MSIPAADGPAGSEAEAVQAAGHFRIYLGAAAGVGKTYAMLNEGHRRQQRGADIVVGLVECHGRPLTEQLIGDLEVIPRKVVEYRAAALRRWTSTRCYADGPRSPSSMSSPIRTCRDQARTKNAGRMSRTC